MVDSTRVTSADVAREAGVSVATVSYVLNQTPGQKISAATTERVQAAAKRLGYVRNRAAQALARGDSGIVIVDISMFPRSEKSDHDFQRFVSHLEASGQTILQTWWGPENWERHLIKLAADTTATAVITVVPASEETRSALSAAGVKTISSLLPAPEHLVAPLQMAGAEQVRHLASRGHTHVLYAPTICPDLGPLNALREAACAHAAAELGLEFTTLPPPGDPADYSHVLTQCLRDHADASAVAAYNDDVALRCLSALHALGVAVPSEVAVIGVDNLSFTASTYPPLTTVEYEYAMGNLDAGVIDSLVKGPGLTGLTAEAHEVVNVHTIERGST